MSLAIVFVSLNVFLYEAEVNVDGQRGIACPSAFDEQECPGFKDLVLFANLYGLIERKHVGFDLDQDFFLLPCDGQEL